MANLKRDGSEGGGLVGEQMGLGQLSIMPSASRRHPHSGGFSECGSQILFRLMTDKQHGRQEVRDVSPSSLSSTFMQSMIV